MPNMKGPGGLERTEWAEKSLLASALEMSARGREVLETGEALDQAVRHLQSRRKTLEREVVEAKGKIKEMDTELRKMRAMLTASQAEVRTLERQLEKHQVKSDRPT